MKRSPPLATPESAGSGRRTAPRLDDLDALRAFVMLLVVLIHAFAFLVPPLPGDPWPAYDAYARDTPPNLNPYVYLAFLVFGGVLGIFFLLSGYLAALTLRRRGLARLVEDRLLRIGAPLVVGVATMLQITGWMFETSDAGLWYNPAADEVHGLHYLWFLYNLLLIMAGFAALVRLGLRFHHPVWLACIPLSAVLLYPMEQPFIGADQTGNMVIPDLKVLAYYALFFLVGVFLQNRDVTPRRSWSLLLLPALLVAFPAALYLIYLAWPADATLEAFTGRRPGSDGLWAAAAAAEAAYAWLMCFGTMGFFRLVAARPRRWVQSVSEASYWVYWAHYPLVVWLQIQVVDWPLNPHLKLLVVITVTLALLLGLYPLVRETPIGTMLNGRRRAARPPPAASPAS